MSKPYDPFAGALNLAYVVIDWDVQADLEMSGPLLAIRRELDGRTARERAALVGHLVAILRGFAMALPAG